MNDTGRDQALVLTTDTWRGRLFRLAFPTLALGVGIVLTVRACRLGRPIHAYDAAGLIALNVMLLGIGLSVAWGSWWGTWFIDEDGITFHPNSGQSRSLRWTEVERVIWLRNQRAILDGQPARIPIPWLWLPRCQVEAGQERILRALDAAFDLTPTDLEVWPATVSPAGPSSPGP